MRHKLPQQATGYEQLARAQTLAEQREQYRWRHLPGMPAHCDGVPAVERQPRWMRENIGYDLAGSLANGVAAALTRFRHNPECLEHFDAYFTFRRKPAVARDGRWMRDEEFARQRLCGINPLELTRVRDVADFWMTDADLPSTAGSHTLADLCSAHRLYQVDYEALADAPVEPGRFVSAPRALFWVDDSGRLMPLAVRLGRGDGPVDPIFTPDDDRWLWQRVKADVQSADCVFHEVVAHLFRTHMVMETVWVAVKRALPAQHPIHELLEPHFTGTIAINESARTVMIVPGGPIDQAASVGSEGAHWLIAEELESWTFGHCHPVNDLYDRGVDDHETLPGYHYADDAMALWKVIDRFVHDVLAVFYDDPMGPVRGHAPNRDVAVQKDDELQAWAKELSDPDCGGLRGLPLEDGRFATFDALHATVAQIVHCAAVEHAAVNNGQWDTLGYIPNAPGAMWTPPPTVKARSNEAEFCAAMPLAEPIRQQMMLAHLLSTPTTTPIGSCRRDWFTDNYKVRKLLDRFRSERDVVTEMIAARNMTLDVPYDYLDPRRIGRSISI